MNAPLFLSEERLLISDWISMCVFLGGKNCHWYVHVHTVALLERMLRPNITPLRWTDSVTWMSR